MPPQNQRRSSSAEDLDEYLKFQQGQQAKQAMSLQQLGAMFNMSQQQVANEIARANLELSRSNQGIAQGRLDLDIASNPSIIAARAADAAYNQARADGYAEDQASVIASRAATTAQAQALTEGQGIANTMAQRVSDSQDTALEQAKRAGESNIAFTDAQTRSAVEQRKALEYTNLYGAQDAKSRSNLLSGQDVRLTLENSQLPTDYAYKAALTSAQIAQIAANANAQVLANEDLPRRIEQDKAAHAVQLQLGGASIASQGINSLGQDIQNQYMPAQYASQKALIDAQIQASLAGTAFGLRDRNALTIPQMQERALTPGSMAPIQAAYNATAATNQAIILADEARQAQSRARQTINVADQPVDLQPAYAEEVAKMDEFYKAQQIKQKQAEANRARNASLHQLNLMRFSDTFDPGSSY